MGRLTNFITPNSTRIGREGVDVRIVLRPSLIRKTRFLDHHLKTKTTKKEGLNTSPHSTVHAKTVENTFPGRGAMPIRQTRQTTAMFAKLDIADAIGNADSDETSTVFFQGRLCR